jgi:hypothetical protein
MRFLIKKIIKEQLSNKQQSLYDLINSSGGEVASKMVGGYDNLIRFLYGGDFKKYVEENNIEVVKFGSDGMSMYLHPSLVELLGLNSGNWKYELILGKFSYGSPNGISYSFTANLQPIKQNGEVIKYKVVGTSGDSGFGYSFITKKNTLGKRYRQQIFKQIVDKYELGKYIR